MTAESQHPYELYTPRELLRRPLEPYRAVAVDPDKCHTVDDAFHVEFGKDNLGRFATITAYLADASLVNSKPGLMDGVEHRAFNRYEGGTFNPLLPRFVLEQLSLNSQVQAGVPALAVKMKVHKKSISLTDIKRVRVHVDTMTYDQFAERSNETEEPLMAIVNGIRILHGKPELKHVYIGANRAAEIIAEYNLVTNKVVARTMRHMQSPWLFRHHTNPPKKQECDYALWSASYGTQPLKHEALKAPQYCHVTSPLRRFPDLANHLNLAALLDYRPLPYSRDALVNLATRLNTPPIKYEGSTFDAA